MKQRTYKIPTLFVLTVILVTIICFQVIWCQEIQLYDLCGQSVRCGNIQLGYPFWGLERPAYCGHSGFQVTCESNVLIFNQDSLNYRIIGMDNSTKTITVARNDLWNTSCPQFIYNTTYNSMLSIDPVFGEETVSLYYGCNSSVPGVPLGNNYKFNCTANGSQSDNYFIRTSLLDSKVLTFLEQCNNHITVPINQFTASQLSLATSTVSDLELALTSGFSLKWMVNNDECDLCGRTHGQCGFNPTSPDLFACYCSNGNFSLACADINEREGSKGNYMMLKLVIAIPCVIAGIMLFLFVMLCVKKRLWKTQKVANHKIEIFIKNYGTLAPKRYKYSEMKKMTNSFKQRLGQGGYGSVYKGCLPNGQLVAVKLLAEALGDGEDFINEVASISRTSHVNIVGLLGFCIEGKKRALMYEFMPNGSLDKFLRGDGSNLDWNTLFLITKGIARGLEYLHQGCKTRIVHFDIKPHNILLDEDFVPKISDFGLAKLCKRKESIVSVTGARGTVGYIAPEVFLRNLGGASHKSDVYSYGMMVLEMTGASKQDNASTTSASEAYFPDQIYKQVEAGDNLKLNGVTTKEEEELARKMVTISLWCIQSDPLDRPSINKVVEMLEGSFESLQVPPRRFWSSMPDQVISAPTTQSSSDERAVSTQVATQANV